MGRTKGTYTLTSNIEPKVGAPLDARTIVKLLADLTASNTFEYPYKGMRVFVEENNKSYTLVGSDPTVSSNWTEDGSGGGHVIKNQTGTNMNQRSNLQFIDMTLSDDAINDITKVENIHVIQSESELDNLPDGLYMLDDEEDTVIDSDLVGYDNTDSGLEATNVKDAIDDLESSINSVDAAVRSKLEESTLASEYETETTMTATKEHAANSKFYLAATQQYCMATDDIAIGDTLEENTNYVAITINGFLTDMETYLILAGQMLDGKANKSEMSVTPGTGTSADKTTIQLKSGTTATVLTAHQDISGKADKVTNATNGNLAGLNGSGNLTDSGWNGAKDTTSISGNPISISGLKSNQLAKDPIITLEPIQAGSGTPSPSNIRAISGYDKIEVLSCGKNIWADGDIGGTRLVTVDLTIPLEPGTYKISAIVTTSDTAYDYCLMMDTSNNLTIGSMGHSVGNQRVSYTMNITKRCTQITFYASASWAASADKTFSYKDVQIEKGGTVTDYVPYNKTTDLSESLGQTVYGGTLDVRTGKLTVTHKMVDMGDYTWVYRGSSDGVNYFNAAFENMLATAGEHSFICECYDSVGQRGTNYTISRYNMYDTSAVIYVNDNRYSGDATGAAALKTALAGVKMVYELATPFTIQLTPHEISLLKDYAYVSTNGTNISLDYHNGELASLSDVSQLGETVNELGDYVGANNLGSQNAIPIPESGDFVCPSDGYVVVRSGNNTSDFYRVDLYGNKKISTNRCVIKVNSTTDSASKYQIYPVYVRKGMIAHFEEKSSGNTNGAAYFVSLE